MFHFTYKFDKLLDKATSHLLMEPDWPLIIQLCDLIRQNDIQPKYALNAVKKKLFSQNQHTALYALLVLESMVKNCGYPLHEELTTRAFCDTLYELAKTTSHENVRQKLFELIQAWNFAFRKSPKHGALKDTMAMMKSDGFKFPAFRESDAMFSADSALQRIQEQEREMQMRQEHQKQQYLMGYMGANPFPQPQPPPPNTAPLFMNITAMHSKLLRNIQQHDDSRLHFKRLQEKLTKVNTFKAPVTDRNGPSLEEQSTTEPAIHLNPPDWEPSSESKFSGHTEERSSMNTFIVGKLYNTERNDNTGSEDVEWNNKKELYETVSDEKPPSMNTFIAGELYNTERNENTGSEDIEWNNEKELDETVSDEKPPTSITKTATSSTSKINDDVFAQFVVVKLNQITDEAVRADVEQKIIQLLYDGLKECEKNS